MEGAHDRDVELNVTVRGMEDQISSVGKPNQDARLSSTTLLAALYTILQQSLKCSPCVCCRVPGATSYRCIFQGSAIDECGNDRNCGTGECSRSDFFSAFVCRILQLCIRIELALGMSLLWLCK